MKKLIISQALGTEAIELGGPGSGNWAHIGRPGKVGGSSTRESGMTVAKGKDWLERYKKRSGRTHPFEKEQTTTPGQKKPVERKNEAVGGDIDVHEKHEAVKKYDRTHDNPGYTFLVNPRRKNTTQPLTQNSFAIERIVDEISERTGVDKFLVQTVLHTWSSSSNGSYRSISLQEDACEILGMELSKWQKDRLAAMKESGKATDAHSCLGMYDDDPRGTAKKVLRAMYEHTQEEFAKKGITHVTLFRGISETVKHGENGLAQWKGNALESWSAFASIANNFSVGGSFVGAKIPVSRIFSTARTGIGQMNEGEFVVIGNSSADDIVTVLW